MWDDSRGLRQGPKTYETRTLTRGMTPMLLASGEERNPRPGSPQTLALLT